MNKVIVNLFFSIIFFSLGLSTGPQTIYVIQNASLLSSSSTGLAKNHYLNPANLVNLEGYISFSNNNANFDLKGQKISLLNKSGDSNSLFSFESLNSSSIPIYGESTSDDGPEGYFDSYWYACEFSRIINASNYFHLFENVTFGLKIKGYMYKLFTSKSSDYSISFGFNKKINEQLKLGLVVNNIGVKKIDNLSNQISGSYDGREEYGVGIYYLAPNDLFGVATDFYFRNNEVVSKLAVETNFPIFNLSLGSTHYSSYKDFCYGFALDLNNWKIEYGYLTYGDTGQKYLGNPSSIQISRIF
tara:strand:+ start:1455 stop:2357 length:903 start_codon:yes stop_codon:yes gene_type:complete